MKLLTAVLALAVFSGQPVSAATVIQSQLSGYVAGEVVCVLKRHHAPDSVIKAELARIIEKQQAADVVALPAHAPQYLEAFKAALRECPPVVIPDA